MRGIHCWAQLPDGTRCGFQALPGAFFCQHHRLDCRRNPALVFRAPVADMPPDLVDHLRAAAPDLVFPEPAPPDPALPASPSPAPAAPPCCKQSGPAADTVAAGHRPAPAADLAPPPPELREGTLSSEPDAAGLDWLLGLLKETMIGVMEGDSQTLQKANAVARLGGLYLKAYGAAELKQANTLLRKRLAELEQRHAAVETPGSDEEAGSGSSVDEALLWVYPGEPVESSLSGAKSGSSACPSPAPAANAATAPDRRRGTSTPCRPGRSGGARRR